MLFVVNTFFFGLFFDVFFLFLVEFLDALIVSRFCKEQRGIDG